MQITQVTKVTLTEENVLDLVKAHVLKELKLPEDSRIATEINAGTGTYVLEIQSQQGKPETKSAPAKAANKPAPAKAPEPEQEAPAEEPVKEAPKAEPKEEVKVALKAAMTEPSVDDIGPAEEPAEEVAEKPKAPSIFSFAKKQA